MSYNQNLILGIAGKKRVGKNSLANIFLDIFAAKNIYAKQYAFADELKKELDPLFLINAGVSAFTEDPTEKELIRGVLIEYGTGFWRKKDPDHWIKRLEQNINAAIPHIVIVTDVRFASNEAPWVKKNGGKLIYLDRLDDSGKFFPPAGKDEEENNPKLMNQADFIKVWNNFSNSSDSTGYYKGEQFFNEIFSQEQITKWQKDFPRIKT